MPNPNAQKNPSFFLPEALQGLADMGRGAVRGALAEGLGGMGDFTQSMKDVRMAGFMPAMLARGLQGPTSEELNQDLRGITPNPLTQPDRAHTARMGQTLGTIPASVAGGVGTNAAAQKAMAKLSSMQKVESVMPKAPKPVAEILKGPDPDLMRVYSGQRIPIEGKFDIMRADPHASMGRAFYTAELPRYANKFTGNQPGANVTPVDVDRNRMLMFDKMYDTPQGKMEGLDYYDMLRRQAMVKPGIGKDMIRQEILDAGFAGTQMPNATGKAYAIYDTSAAQDMSGRGFAKGGMVTGRHNDDGSGAIGADSWRADNASDGVPRMAFGGFFNAPKAPPAGSITIDPIESAPYQGINPMASGLGQQVFENKLKQDSSDFMALQRQNRFANQGADRLARQNQLAAAKTARLNALAPKLSTYVAPKAQGGLAHMAGGGVVRMSKGGRFGVPIEAAAKVFKALPGQSFQGKTGLSALSPDEEARRIIAKMDQPTVEDALAKISKPSNLEEALKQKKAPAVKKVKPETEASVPFSIPRAAPKTDTEIRDIAERVARQQLGEHVRGKTSSNLAGRSMAEVERLKQLEYELTPNKQLPPVQIVEPMYGDVNVAIPGDQSISDTILTSIRGEPIGALQQGGSRYGLGQLDRPLYAQAAWKSNIAASRGLQNRVDRLAKYYEKMSESQKFDYDPTRILGTYFGMGTDAMNYAQHFTDANLRAIQNRIKSGLMSDADIQQFNEIIRKGNPSVEGKKGGPFPDFPGIENMEESYIAMTNDPNMRKWFNNRMKTPSITEKLNMPDGKEIEWAISETELRNLEPFTTGHSIVQLRPGEQIALDPGHITYTHRIPGKMLGRQQELSPIEMSHPDTIEFLRKNYKPSEVITTAQKIFPVQRVDQQYMDEMGKYQQYLRDIRGFKKGGKPKKMQAGGIAKAVKSGIQALEKPAKQTITSAIDPTTDIASRLTQPDRVNLLPMPSRWFLDPKNNPGVQKLVEKVLEVNNMKRSDFYSGAFVNPRTGEVMDKKVMQDVGVLINPMTGRPMMSAEKETDLTIGDRKKGSITKSNLVRKQLYETEGDPILKDLDFLVAIEQSGMGHKYGLATEYATPAEMFNTMTGDNPTLRPKSQGDVFGIGDIVGRMSMKSSKMPHDVYESLLIAPKGSDVQGVKLSKKHGGRVKGRK
jgi:hypothetical protein